MVPQNEKAVEMGTSGLTMKRWPGRHPQLTPPLLHLYHILCIFSHLLQSHAFSGIIWAGSRLGLVANTQWKVWWRSSVAHPCCPCRHRLCALKHSSPCALLLHQGRSTSVTPDCVYSTPFFILCIQIMPLVGQLKWVTLRKCLFSPASYQCQSQLDSRNTNVYVSTLK